MDGFIGVKRIVLEHEETRYHLIPSEFVVVYLLSTWSNFSRLAVGNVYKYVLNYIMHSCIHFEVAGTYLMFLFVI